MARRLSRTLAPLVAFFGLGATTPCVATATDYPATGPCAEQFRVYGSDAAAYYVVLDQVNACNDAASAAQAQSAQLNSEIEAIEKEQLDLLDEQVGERRGIARCERIHGPAVHAAGQSVNNEVGVTTEALDAAVLSCLVPSVDGLLECVLSLLNLSDQTDAIRAAVNAYVTAKQALEDCKGPHVARIEEIQEKQNELTEKRLALQVQLALVVIPDCSDEASTLDSARRNLQRSQAALEACLRTAQGNPNGPGNGGETRG